MLGVDYWCECVTSIYIYLTPFFSIQLLKSNNPPEMSTDVLHFPNSMVTDLHLIVKFCIYCKMKKGRVEEEEQRNDEMQRPTQRAI